MEHQSNKQLWIIFIVFGITGSSSVKVGKPLLELIGLQPEVFTDFPLNVLLLDPKDISDLLNTKYY